MKHYVQILMPFKAKISSSEYERNRRLVNCKHQIKQRSFSTHQHFGSLTFKILAAAAFFALTYIVLRNNNNVIVYTKQF